MRKTAIKYELKKRQMLKALQGLCALHMTQETLPPPELWPKTRELADRCGENIYVARTLLLALEKEGEVCCTHRSINNSLRWFICTDRASAHKK
ncbi:MULTISPECIES: hypothetical protein [unclassified Serratia (in: enterobacteria)]|uniref:hypothetical protein n=1 Tax=unclassified Serratia (in: enterobacteria) TaxID=2647522 RepID=UPI0030761F92